MKTTPYDRNRKFDVGLSWVMNTIKNTMKKKDDDHFLICVGSTGTGKTSLGLWAYEEFDPENCTVENVGLDPKQFARALGNASTGKSKFCMNDEANISKRQHSTAYNKDVLDLYFSIRGERLFHWWNNPSLDIIDKPFIEEKLNSVIYIASKDIDRPRIYFYFTKQKILQLLRDKKDLKLTTLHKYADEYASFKGWFKGYDGKLWEEYLEKKKARMKYKIDEFIKKYSEDSFTQAQVAKRFGVSDPTIYSYHKELLAKKELILNEDFFVNEIGKRFYTIKGVDKIKTYANSKINVGASERVEYNKPQTGLKP